MPATLSIKLEGMTDLLAAMRRLPVVVRGQALEGAVRRGAEVIAQAAGGQAAGAFQSRTGKLLRTARSLTARMIQVLARSPEYVLMQIWPRLPYTHLVEGGHRVVARGPGRGGADRATRALLRRALLARRAAGASGVVAPRPFVGPAFEATKEAAAERVLNELWQSVEQAWTGGR